MAVKKTKRTRKTSPKKTIKISKKHVQAASTIIAWLEDVFGVETPKKRTPAKKVKRSTKKTTRPMKRVVRRTKKKSLSLRTKTRSRKKSRLRA